ncbi:EamA family transporter [Heliobacterium gestii]|uniref:EamA family transporter n=1 Tax=Heliomicrobium gestii TaxID=2699 RepID=A0A845L613_HELGE|nr:DMT family transporter [Heliomicrobium gestii]MBM7865821.1 drug/metabolite transporter (DMT)-like permease [Heliomicrobium gestii]MZP42062.1 EamA family transporter [Heliomicrobium gestii]
MHHQGSSRVSPLTADLILLSVAAIWGGTFVAVKNAIAIMPPYTFLAIRFLIAGLFLAVVAGRRWRSLTGATIRHGALLGSCLFGGYALQTIGLQYTTSSHAGFITGLSVVLVPLVSWFILKQAPRSGVLAGIVLAVVGLGLLTLTDDLTMNPGDLLVLGCAFCFGLHIFFAGQFTSRHDPMLLSIMQIFAVSIACAAFAFFSDPPLAADQFQSEVWTALALTAIPATSLAFLAQMYFQKFTTATRTALIFATEPVFALIFGVALAGEALTLRGALGGVLVMAGIVASEMIGAGESGDAGVDECDDAEGEAA